MSGELRGYRELLGEAVDYIYGCAALRAVPLMGDANLFRSRKLALDRRLEGPDAGLGKETRWS